MFQDIVDPSIRVGSRKALALPLSIVAHVVVVALALLVPLMAPSVLPSPAGVLIAFVSKDVVLPAEPPPPPRRLPAAPTPETEPRPLAAPLEAPSTLTPESTLVLAPPAVGTIEGSGNVRELIAGDLFPPPPPPPAAPDDPIRVGGDVRPPTKIKDVTPLYPAIARAARVEGVVIIETTIGTTGRVLDARLLRSIPLLDGAALDAVRQWEFTPTMLNGTPVAVVMTVTVNFTLQ